MNNNLLYCEDCSKLTEQTVCPKCGKPAREPNDGDLCYVGEFGDMGQSMFADALNNNGIEFVCVPVHGGFTQLNTPNGYKIYVRYRDYGKALELFDVLFSDNGEAIKNEDWIDRIVKVTIDRPIGSIHPEHADIEYELNYGHIEGVVGGDGEWQDAYILDFNYPDVYVGKEISGCVVAVIVRKNDTETKLAVTTDLRKHYTKEQIAQAVNFQEKYFDIEIIM